MGYYLYDWFCLVPVRRFPSPSRSIRFGDVFETNGRETASHFRMDHVTRNALAARKNEAKGLGNDWTWTYMNYMNFIYTPLNYKQVMTLT